MSKLIEYKNALSCYYLDEEDVLQGEYKMWWDNGHRSIHCFVKDGDHHGEYKSWYISGGLCKHIFYQNHNDITEEVKALVEDIDNITKEERMMIKLKFGIECLS